MKFKLFNTFSVGNIVEVLFYESLLIKNKILKFVGIVISINKNTGSFIVRKNSHGFGVEYLFKIDSPKIYNIIIKEKLYFRKSKLYFLRDNVYKKRKKIINKY